MNYKLEKIYFAVIGSGSSTKGRALIKLRKIFKKGRALPLSRSFMLMKASLSICLDSFSI